MLFGLINRGPVVPVIRLSGVIGPASPMASRLNLAGIAGVIERAFSVSKAKAIAVQVNSPGGSPVQSMLIFKRIRALADEKKLPVYVFTEDVAASGGYILSLAGDEIYADKSSIVGSIGVVSAGFGFHKLIEKYDVERRVYTAGTRKFSFDPFKPEDPEDVKKIKEIQTDMHTTFIDLVKARRGSKIDANSETLFTGEFWTGNQAIELGLVDGIADLRSKMREKFGEKVRLKLISPPKGLFSRLRGMPAGSLEQALFSQRHSLAEDVVSTLEARALWARYGL